MTAPLTQSTARNRKFVLANRPKGEPDEHTLRLETEDLATPGHGQMLLRNEYLSLDPYMRGRMSDAPSYAAPVQIGAVMVGGTVGQVVSSDVAGFTAGDWVVAGASGPVGATVGQIGKILGLHVVGIAGGAQKCAHVVDTLGFDACIDYKADGFPRALKAAVPHGIDIYFENVGGAVFDAVLPLLNPKARIPVCGLISQYNATALPDGPDRMNLLLGMILRKRMTVRGFIVFDDFGHLYTEFAKQMTAWVAAGAIQYREEIIEGLERAPAAFARLLRGEAFGKRVVKLSA